jgi:hypothetical protein
MQPTILTAAGREFDLLQPHRSEFGIDEIAHALSQICRFTGHTRTHYSVAQHSVLVSYVVPDEHAMAGLMHDAAEAFVNDLASPLKHQLSRYKDIERGVEHAVMARFGLDQLRWQSDARAAVAWADRLVTLTELRDLLPSASVLAGMDGAEVLPWTIEPLPASLAKSLFLRRFEQLGGVR